MASVPPSEELVAKCMELGLMMYTSDGELTHPPLTLQPLRMASSVLNGLRQKQLLWNAAIDRAARHSTFLSETLKETAKSDASFIGRLLSLYQSIYLTAPHEKPKVFQPIMLGIFRTDYMAGSELAMEQDVTAWKNVEVNTISVSFSGLAPLVPKFHGYVKAYDTALSAVVSHGEVEETEEETEEEVAAGPVLTDSSQEVAMGLAAAHQEWENSVSQLLTALVEHSPQPLTPVIIFVVQEGERNTADQYKLIFNIMEAAGIVCLRRTLSQLHSSMRLVTSADVAEMVKHTSGSSPSFLLLSSFFAGSFMAPFAIVEERYVASVFYFRSTYVPEDLYKEECWLAREWIERSNAVKCPSLPYHLMTTKKVQQRLTDVKVLSEVCFDHHDKDAAALAAHFVPQYSLNEKDVTSGDCEARIQDAVQHPERYVLKPQLEGGGNIYSGQKMQEMLRDTPRDSELYRRIRQEFILMEKIVYPYRDVGCLLRKEVLQPQRMCSELGLYGVVLSNGLGSNSSSPSGGDDEEEADEDDQVEFMLNRYAGLVVRTKAEGLDDGGVMAGNACLDSLMVLSS